MKTQRTGGFTPRPTPVPSVARHWPWFRRSELAYAISARFESAQASRAIWRASRTCCGTVRSWRSKVWEDFILPATPLTTPPWAGCARKRRSGKAFAIMARNLETARTALRDSPRPTEACWQALRRPVVLMRRRGGGSVGGISANVAPGTAMLGVSAAVYAAASPVIRRFARFRCAGDDQREA